MILKSFKIENFKSIQSLEIVLNPTLSMLTGVNNCGKTTILEAIALWTECYNMLSRQAEKSVTGRYKKGDYILGTTNNHYIEFGSLTSVPVANFEDLFYERDIKRSIRLVAILENTNLNISIPIGFIISNSSQSRYALRLENVASFDYDKYNRMFQTLPHAIATHFSSPVANIITSESFMTEPLIRQHLSIRESSLVMRNRIYKLFHSSNSRYQQFEQHLSYILFGSALSAKIRLTPVTNMQQHPNVVIVYKDDVSIREKDLSLLGSGALQAIEILLNIYHSTEDKKDLYLILLDEPDSHIHRDVQKRLFEVLNQMGDANQIILTTHNESLIRTTPLNHIFHIDSAAKRITCLSSKDLNKLNIPHFKGLYPSVLNPIIKSLNTTAVGLDFVSAIEADLIVFVEGDDDARLLNSLFYQNAVNSNLRVMFWVLGGVTKVFDTIGIYKQFFSEIKNSKTLWQKSCLVFDQDRLMDEHKAILVDLFNQRMQLRVACLDVYTQEAVLLTDLHLLAQILIQKYVLPDAVEQTLVQALQRAVEQQSNIIKSSDRYKIDDHFLAGYKGAYIDKINNALSANIRQGDADLVHKMDEYYKNCPIYKLATKDDVSEIINSALSSIGCADIYNPEDCYSLARITDFNRNFNAWKQIITFLSTCAKS